MNTGEKVIQNEDLAKEAIIENLAAKRALADPLPGPSGEAFIGGPIVVGGKTVYQVVPRYFQALKAIDSPLIGAMQDVVSEGKVDTEFTDEQAWEICWIFTNTPKVVRETLAKGAGAVKEASMSEVGETPEYPVNLVIVAVMEQLKRHLATAVKFAAEAKEEGKLTFFQDSATTRPEATVGS